MGEVREMTAVLRQARAWLLLTSLAAGLLMVVVSTDLADFAPVKLSPYLLYLVMAVQGALAVQASRDTRTLLVAMFGANILSLALFVGAIMAVMHAIGIPLVLDLVIAWTVRPVFMYSLFGIALGFFGVLAGMIWHPW